MSRILPSTLLIVCILTVTHGADVGVFWQITDIHYDVNYSQTVGSSCRSQSSGGLSDDRRGQFGDYMCDSPWNLVVSAINAMKLLSPNPDFILWTGDNVAHVLDSDLDPIKVFNIVHNVTTKLQEVFPNVTIFPVLGNHDVWPSNQLPARPGGYYDNIMYSAGWDSMLGDEAKETFQKGGFYSLMTPSGQRLLALNTNIYYYRDKLSANLTDPLLQIMWLQQQLAIAQSRGEKVYIVTHVPPGSLARAANVHWYVDRFNQMFVDVLQTYHQCIMAVICGHEHTDSFKIVYSKQGVPLVPIFVAPAVTPWMSTIPGIGANNPSIRLYHYDRRSALILDYDQYYLNLTAANAAGRADWQLEYSPSEAYSAGCLSADGLARVLAGFLPSSSRTFHRYYEYNSVSYDADFDCDVGCRLAHVCAISNISYADYRDCMSHLHATIGWQDTHFPAAMMHHRGDGRQDVLGDLGDLGRAHSQTTPVFVYFVVGGVVVLVSVMLLVMTLLCFRRRTVASYFSQPQYMPINA